MPYADEDDDDAAWERGAAEQGLSLLDKQQLDNRESYLELPHNTDACQLVFDDSEPENDMPLQAMSAEPSSSQDAAPAEDPSRLAPSDRHQLPLSQSGTEGAAEHESIEQTTSKLEYANFGSMLVFDDEQDQSAVLSPEAHALWHCGVQRQERLTELEHVDHCPADSTHAPAAAAHNLLPAPANNVLEESFQGGREQSPVAGPQNCSSQVDGQDAEQYQPCELVFECDSPSCNEDHNLISMEDAFSPPLDTSMQHLDQPERHGPTTDYSSFASLARTPATSLHGEPPLHSVLSSIHGNIGFVLIL